MGSSSSTDLPITEVFEAIETFQTLEELDKITIKLTKMLHKLFMKVPTGKISSGVYVRKYNNITYYPNGLCTDQYQNKKIILEGYEDPGITDQTMIEQVKLKKARITAPRRILCYTNVKSHNTLAYLHVFSTTNRSFNRHVLLVDKKPIYQIMNHYKKIFDLPKEALTILFQTDKRLADRLNNFCSSLYWALSFAHDSAISDNLNKPMLFYSEEMIENINKAYYRLEGNESNLSWNDTDTLRRLIKHECRKENMIDIGLKIGDFHSINNNHSWCREGSFENFLTTAYPKILKACEDYPHLKVLFQKLEIVTPLTDEEKAEIKKQAKLETKRIKESIEQEALNLEIIDIEGDAA